MHAKNWQTIYDALRETMGPERSAEHLRGDLWPLSYADPTPFLLGIRPTGCWLVRMHGPAGSRFFSWPATKATFKPADMLYYYANSVRSIQFMGSHRWLWFDGQDIKEITQGEAETVADIWRRSVSDAWKLAQVAA